MQGIATSTSAGSYVSNRWDLGGEFVFKLSI